MKDYDLQPFLDALHYDRKTGTLSWKAGPRKWRRAGYVTKAGYRHVTVGGVEVAEHRLIWAIETGEWPTALIDHKDGKKAHNRFRNLRECDYSGNAQNTVAAGSAGRSLPKGVHRDSRTGNAYSARIVKNGKCIYLGYFQTPEDAHAAYLAAKAELHTFQRTPRAA